jgi:DNA repair protein RecO (recombination protein O)
MITKVEGIVISEADYSESSKIINVITKEYGKIGIIAKGSKKMKSSLRGVSGKLTYGYFHIYYKKGKLSDLICVDVINNLKNIKSDIIKISYAAFIMELVDQIIKEDYEEEIYNLFINTILKIEEGFDPLVITNILELKLLDYLGVTPVIDCCAICGDNKSIATLSSDKGGYVCIDCLDNDKIVSEKAIKLIRMLYYVDIAKITKLEVSDSVKKEIDTFINEYYDKYTGLYLKTKSFLNNLLKL